MAHRGIEVGQARRPLLPLADADHAGLVAALDLSIQGFAALSNG